MRESSTYQMILEEGRVEGQVAEARRLVLELGTDKFGPPDETVRFAVERLDSLELLHRLARGVLRASSWEGLLAAVSDG